MFVLSVAGARPAAGVVQVGAVSEPRRHRTPRACWPSSALQLGDDVEIRVWDSTAELRYLVVPLRPAGTDGWSEEQLADVVTRNSMIGTEVVAVP